MDVPSMPPIIRWRGSIEFHPEDFHLIMQVQRGLDNSYVWSEAADGQVGDLSCVDRLAQALLRDLTAGPSELLLARRQSVPEESRDLYLQGRYFWKLATPDSIRESVGCFTNAVASDENYAAAWAALSEAVLVSSMFGLIPPAEAGSRMKQAALRATSLNPHLPEAHVALGSVLSLLDWEWSAGSEELQKSIQLDSHEPVGHIAYGIHLACCGMLDSAVAEVERALELDPASLFPNFVLGWLYGISRRFDEAISQHLLVSKLATDYGLPHLGLGLAYAGKKQFGDAIAHLTNASQMKCRSLLHGQMGYCYAMSGRQEEALREIGTLNGAFRNAICFAHRVLPRFSPAWETPSRRSAIWKGRRGARYGTAGASVEHGVRRAAKAASLSGATRSGLVCRRRTPPRPAADLKAQNRQPVKIVVDVEQIGRYRILGELGRGAAGIVYRAQDPAIGRTIAIKTIRLSDITDEAERARLRERLFREAQSAGILSHPNIVTIYDIAEENGLAYIFMEFVDGPPLEKDPQQRGAAGRRTVALSILRQTAIGLDYAHKKGIVHRDIKPANILIHEGTLAKITDFGVAKILSQQMTQAGVMMGTPNYMSPEQVQGHAVDGRADQFSLAVIAYEILTGEKPFVADQLPSLALPDCPRRSRGAAAAEFDLGLSVRGSAEEGPGEERRGSLSHLCGVCGCIRRCLPGHPGLASASQKQLAYAAYHGGASHGS